MDIVSGDTTDPQYRGSILHGNVEEGLPVDTVTSQKM
jgi:hypothetical protein